MYLIYLIIFVYNIKVYLYIIKLYNTKIYTNHYIDYEVIFYNIYI